MASITISGTAYADRGVTTMGSGRTVNVSVNGAASAASATTGADGTFTTGAFTSVSGDVLTVYLQGNTEAAATVTRSAGANVTGVDLYQDHLCLRNDDGTALTNANLNTSDANGATGISAIYAATSNTALTLASGKHLLVMSGQTYAPGTSALIALSGDFVNNGTYTKAANSSDTLSLTGSGTVKTNGAQMGVLSLNTGSGTYTLQDAWNGNGSLGIAGSMTLDVSASNYAVSCLSWVCTGGTFVARAGTVTIISGTSSIRQSNSGAFYNLAVGGSSGTATLSTAGLTVSNNLTISAGKTLDVSTGNLSVTVGGNWSKSGNFTARSGTVTLNGTAQTLSGSTTFYDLVANNSGDVLTITDGTTQTFSHSVTLQNVTVQGSGTAGYTFAMPSSQTIDHLTISRCTATGNAGVAGTGSVDGGSNVNWTFPSAASAALGGLSGLSGLSGVF